MWKISLVPNPSSASSLRLGFPSLADGLSPPCSPPAPLPLVPHPWGEFGGDGEGPETFTPPYPRDSPPSPKEKLKLTADFLGCEGDGGRAASAGWGG